MTNVLLWAGFRTLPSTQSNHTLLGLKKHRIKEEEESNFPLFHCYINQLLVGCLLGFLTSHKTFETPEKKPLFHL